MEIQYRTLVQHAWATANEVIGFVTENQPKFQQGDERYQQTMVYASEILARSSENTTGPLPDLNDDELVDTFLRLDRNLHLLATLRGLNSSELLERADKNAILMFSGEEDLVVHHFAYATDALRTLYQLEREYPENDIVLVRADTSDDVREAFKNYFSDATDFLRLMDEGCAHLRQRNRL